MPSKSKPILKPKARIDKLANEDASAQHNFSNSCQDAIDRVKKCHERAYHTNANEQEAKAAVRMAARIMERYHISQADIMVNESESQRAKRGGFSTVDIWPPKVWGRPFISGWVLWLASAMVNFFECKDYSTSMRDRIQWTFYGIVENTVSAAIAFEAIHNQILDWSQDIVGPTAVAGRNSYCQGVAEGLLRLSRSERKARMARALEAERKALAARMREEEEEDKEKIAREQLAHLDLENGSDSDERMDADEDDATNPPDLGRAQSPDNASDNEVLPDFAEQGQGAAPRIDLTADFNTQLQQNLPREREKEDIVSRDAVDTGKNCGPITKDVDQATHVQETHVEETAEWKSTRQLGKYREAAMDIAESVVKEQGIKFRTRRKRTVNVKDMTAFEIGQAHSKEIDIRAARIERHDESQGDAMDMDG
ncbi:MAG: hypothetical protein Q9170_002180 [Blastenia crenularia]